MTGSNALVSELARYLSTLLSSSKAFKLIVPHCYAKPNDIDRLPEDRRSILVVDGEDVNYLFDKHNSSSNFISKALGSLLANDAVAWLVSADGNKSCPIAALVKIFDGDGWLVFGDIRSIVV